MEAKCVFALFLLSVRHFELFLKLIKLKVIKVDDGVWFLFIQDNVPTFFFEKRIGWSTAEITKSVGFNSNYDLKNVMSSNKSLFFNFEIALDFYFRVVLNAFFDIDWSIGIQVAQESLPFFFFLDKCPQVNNSFILFLLQ